MADTFRGIFLDGIHARDAETKEILRDSYPYADIARAYVVHVDREVPSADGAVGIMFAGTALVIGGLGVGGYRLYYQTRHGA